VHTWAKRMEITRKEILTRGAKAAAGTALARPLSMLAATAPIEKLIGIQIGAISFVDEAERLEAGYKPL
jgi:uncharacterized protein (DUF2384 family)